MGSIWIHSQWVCGRESACAYARGVGCRVVDRLSYIDNHLGVPNSGDTSVANTF